MARKNRGRKSPSPCRETRRDVEISIEPLLPQSDDNNNGEYIRIVKPYLYTFASHVKRRWIGQQLIDVYTNEFGGYSRAYYEAAIVSGKILVSNERASSSDYCVKDGDILSHSVHLHEPAVLVSPEASEDGGAVIKIVEETNDLLVVDKPSTMAVHPCGSHQYNSLTKILESQREGSMLSLSGAISADNKANNKLYVIHRLDRVTSGLCLLAKSSSAAQLWSKAMIRQPQHAEFQDDVKQQRVHKWYLARVQGKFPMNMDSTKISDDHVPRISVNDGKLVTGGVHENESETKEQKVDDRRKCNAFGYWMSHETTKEVFRFQRPIDYWLSLTQQKEQQLLGTSSENGSHENADMWLHLACPTRIAQHNAGICQAGSFRDLSDEDYIKSVKASQTAFGVVSYSKETNSTLLVCKPSTGRSHQIRLHLQKLGHSIANDENYGGVMWYGNAQGQEACQKAKSQLECEGDGDHDLTHLSKIPREEDEGIEDYIARTCIWCAGNNVNHDANATAKLKFLTEGRGIWLRATKYQLTTDSDDNGGPSFQAEPPSWAFL